MQVPISIQSKGAWLHMSEVVGVRRLFFSFYFLTLMRNATGPPAGPVNTINGSNDVSRWKLHSLYGLDYKNLYLASLSPKICKLCNALQPMGTLNGYISGTVEDRAKNKDVCAKGGFMGSGNLTASSKFAPHRPLLSWQPTGSVWWFLKTKMATTQIT